MTEVPETVSRIAQLMSTFPARWSLCGGWAVDAWLGRQTRDHLDLDISVFEMDQLAIFEHLTSAGWHMIAHDEQVAGNSVELWNGRPLTLPAHLHVGETRESVIAWTRGEPVSDFKLEVVVDEHSNGDWVLRRPPRVSLPVQEAIRESAWGVPTSTPEVLLFYKATANFGVEGMKERPHDEIDFFALLPVLPGGRRDWLRKAIGIVHPTHPWLSRMG